MREGDNIQKRMNERKKASKSPLNKEKNIRLEIRNKKFFYFAP